MKAMTKPRRYGGKTEEEFRQSGILRETHARAAILDMLDTIDELAATLAGALDILDRRLSELRLDEARFKVRARKLVDEVTK